jgi:hypothetical protein
MAQLYLLGNLSARDMTDKAICQTMCSATGSAIGVVMVIVGISEAAAGRVVAASILIGGGLLIAALSNAPVIYAHLPREKICCPKLISAGKYQEI